MATVGPRWHARDHLEKTARIRPHVGLAAAARTENVLGRHPVRRASDRGDIVRHGFAGDELMRRAEVRNLDVPAQRSGVSDGGCGLVSEAPK